MTPRAERVVLDIYGSIANGRIGVIDGRTCPIILQKNGQSINCPTDWLHRFRTD